MSETPNKHLVSIGLPTYNRADMLPLVIERFLGQTYKNFELIISDNCSVDGTQAICESYAKRDSRIRYFMQKENIGHANNFSFLLNSALGDYYMLASDDDWWAPTFVERLATALDHNSGYDIAMSSFSRVSPDGRVISQLVFDGPDDLVHLDYGEVFLKAAYPIKPFNYFIYGLMRTEFVRKFFRHTPHFARADRVIVCEMALSTHFYSVPEVLYKKTVWDGRTLDRHKDILRPVLRKLEVSYFFYNLGKRIIFSNIVPTRHKLIYFLPNYAKAVWRHRWRIIRGGK